MAYDESLRSCSIFCISSFVSFITTITRCFFDFSLVLSQKVVVQGLAFAEKSLAVAKGENLHFRVERSESDTPLEAKISIQSGTGVHGVAYQDEIQVLQFQTGESKKDLCSVGLCLM